MSNKILVITPNPLLATTLSARLESGNCIIQTASDNRLVLKTVQNWLPNLVIIDDDLPSKQHLKICRRLRKSRSVVIILATTMERRAMTQAYHAGATFYILKQGQDLRALLLTVQTALKLQPDKAEIMPGLAQLEWHNN